MNQMHASVIDKNECNRLEEKVKRYELIDGELISGQYEFSLFHSPLTSLKDRHFPDLVVLQNYSSFYHDKSI